MKQAVESNADRQRRWREEAAKASEMTLADKINAAHRTVEELFHGALKRAVEAGELLMEAKSQVSHGQWLPWLEANCRKVPNRTAQAYMKLAANKTNIAHLDGVAEALKFLSASMGIDEDPPVRAVRALPSAPKSVSTSRPPAALPAPPARPAATIIEAEFEEIEEDLPAELPDDTGQLTEVEAIRVYLVTFTNGNQLTCFGEISIEPHGSWDRALVFRDKDGSETGACQLSEVATMRRVSDGVV